MEGVQENIVVKTQKTSKGFELSVEILKDTHKLSAIVHFLDCVADGSFRDKKELLKLSDNQSMAWRYLATAIMDQISTKKCKMTWNAEKGLRIEIRLFTDVFEWIITTSCFKRKFVVPKKKKNNVEFLSKTVCMLLEKIEELETTTRVYYAKSAKIEEGSPFVLSLLDHMDSSGKFKYNSKLYQPPKYMSCTSGIRPVLSTYKLNLYHAQNLSENLFKIKVIQNAPIALLQGTVFFPKLLFKTKHSKRILIALTECRKTLMSPCFFIKYEWGCPFREYRVIAHFELCNGPVYLEIDDIYMSNGTQEEFTKVSIMSKIGQGANTNIWGGKLIYANTCISSTMTQLVTIRAHPNMTEPNLLQYGKIICKDMPMIPK